MYVHWRRPDSVLKLNNLPEIIVSIPYETSLNVGDKPAGVVRGIGGGGSQADVKVGRSVAVAPFEYDAICGTVLL